MSLRVCAEPGCPNLQPEARCVKHRRQRERQRGSSSQRGYDYDYEKQKLRPEYVDATHCTACGDPFTPDNPKTAGHSVAIRHGGKGSKIVPQCRRCNYGWQRTGL